MELRSKGVELWSSAQEITMWRGSLARAANVCTKVPFVTARAFTSLPVVDVGALRRADATEVRCYLGQEVLERE